MSKVTIYTTPTCAYCHMAKDYFKSKGVEFEEINIADPNNSDALRFVVQQSGQAATPFITVGEQDILGFDRTRIDAALAKLKAAA